MHARVTPYRMKDGARETAISRMNDLKEAIMAMPGMRNFINVMNDDGTGYVVALVDSKEISDANFDRTMEMWGRFSDLLEATPDATGYEVMANWAN